MFYEFEHLKRRAGRMLYAIGHRHGGHRPGHGSGRWGHRWGGDVPGARKLSASDLQLIILAMLAEQPRHGYELIKLLEERSGGFYSPSPGVIYPALTYLEEIRFANVEPDGARKLYLITEQGKTHLDANRSTADAILDALARIGSRMENVRNAFAGVDDEAAVGSDDVRRAYHALKHALKRMRGCDAAEARRIVQILDQASADILGKAR
jgi:DNA-binding PadR family transcriptional regulator